MRSVKSQRWRFQVQSRNGEAAGGGRAALAKSCVQVQLSDEAAGENAEYAVEGGGVLATFRHPRKLLKYSVQRTGTCLSGFGKSVEDLQWRTSTIGE